MKSPQNHFCPFWSLSNFTLPNIPKCSQTLWTCSNGLINHLDQMAQVGEQHNITKSPENHFCPFWSLSNFTLPNMSKCSKTLWTCSNGLIIHIDQMAQVGEQVNLIKVPQNPFCLEPYLNNFALPTFSPWHQLLWTCSEPQMMTLRQVAHQGE